MELFLVVAADYRKWDAAPREMIVRDDGYMPNEAPFEGMPTYQRDYIKHPMAGRSSMKPVETARMTDAPFEDRTGYRDEYIKHPLQERQKKEKAVYAPNPSKLEGLSNYMKDYTPKEGAKMASCKPDLNPYQSNAPFEDETTNRHDYTKKHGERPYVHHPDAYVKPDGDMLLNTTTHTDYVPKKIDRQLAKKPVTVNRSPGEFRGVTNYTTDFKEWPHGERPKVTMRSEYIPPDAPFSGTPTYQRDYIKHPHAMRGSMKPVENAKTSDAPFEDRTGYRDEYIKHPLAEKQKKEKAAWAPNPAKLEGLSNYMKDYVPKEAGKLPSCKPDANPYQSSAPFQDETTNRHDYTLKRGERPYVHQQDAYVKPEGDMLLNTTTHTDYVPKATERIQIRKPPSAKRAPGKFYGQTNYTTDFRKMSAEPVRVVQKSDYKPNEAPFEGMPTYQRDFVKYNSAPVRSMKPADGGYQSGAPFEGSTEYKNEYIKKKVPPCPVTIINSGGDAGFSFENQDETGHKWYQQTPRVVNGGPVTTTWETKSTGAFDMNFNQTQPLLQSVAWSVPFSLSTSPLKTCYDDFWSAISPAGMRIISEFQT